MNGFVRTMAYGLALIGILLLSGGITVMIVVNKSGGFDPHKLRKLVLSTAELDTLDAAQHRQQESSDAPVKTENAKANEEQMLSELADMANASHVTQLVSKIHREEADLNDRQSNIDQKWADLQLAKAGLERMERQLQEQQQSVQEETKQDDLERQRWASAVAAEKMHVEAMGVIEKARYVDQAKLFEQMKDAAWQSLRRMAAPEIARYLSLMNDKKAARMLILAQQDTETPNLVTQIQKEMLKVDLDNASGDQTERLATIYSFMPAEQVLPYLKDSSVRDVAGIVGALTKMGQLKRSAALMEALRKQDSNREMDVRHMLEQGDPTTPAPTTAPTNSGSAAAGAPAAAPTPPPGAAKVGGP